MAKERMYIQVTENYRRITSDPLNIIVEGLTEPKQKEGEEPKAGSWTVESYHRTMEQAINAILEKEIHESAAKSLIDLKYYISDVRQEILDSVKHAKLTARTD